MSSPWCLNFSAIESTKVSDGLLGVNLAVEFDDVGAPDKFASVVGPKEKRVLDRIL
jgi:hypothetical protein